MGLEDSVRDMQLEALNLPKKPIALDKPKDYANNGGRASSLPIRDLPLYQLAWDRSGWSVAVEANFCGDNLDAILREEMPSNPSDYDAQFTARVVRISVPNPENPDKLAEAMRQLAGRFHDAYRAAYDSELPLKVQETEGLIITAVLFPNSLVTNLCRN